MQSYELRVNLSKIISRITGGLGNQLFSYAAARRLAYLNDAELVIDDISGFKYDFTFQRSYQLHHFEIRFRKASYFERLEPFSRPRRWLFRKYNQTCSFMNRTYLYQEFRDFDSRLINFRTKGTVYLEGNWQSEQYFSDISEIIRKDMNIIPPTDSINQQMADRILASPNAVAIHVRFFDVSEKSKSINNASDHYYKQAIHQMLKICPEAHFYLFSELPDVARNLIHLPNERITLVDHNNGDENAYADLWLMTQCQHFITANSSFSWWGAWLAENIDKQIITPGFKKYGGISSWGFDGLIPDSWIRI